MATTKHAPAPVTRRRLSLAGILVLVSLALAARSVFSFVRHEGQILRHEWADIVAEQERQAKWRRTERLQRQIEAGGAAFATVKGPFDDLDLTHCQASELILADVKEFASLCSDSPFYSISLSLWPSFCDAHIDDLAGIPSLKYLDVSMASLSDEGLQTLRCRLPDGVTVESRRDSTRLH